MEMRDEWESPGTIWPCVAACGSPGMSKLHVCMERKAEPFGKVMVMRLLSICLLLTCACARMKWLVALQSPRAYCLGICVGMSVVGLFVMGWGVMSLSLLSSLRRAK
jgi:hypothetical protein